MKNSYNCWQQVLWKNNNLQRKLVAKMAQIVKASLYSCDWSCKKVETRRFTLEGSNFIALQQKITQIFPSIDDADDIILTWTGKYMANSVFNSMFNNWLIADTDGDQVTISSDEELADAFDNSHDILKLHVKNKSKYSRYKIRCMYLKCTDWMLTGLHFSNIQNHLGKSNFPAVGSPMLQILLQRDSDTSHIMELNPILEVLTMATRVLIAILIIGIPACYGLFITCMLLDVMHTQWWVLVMEMVPRIHWDPGVILWALEVTCGDPGNPLVLDKASLEQSVPHALAWRAMTSGMDILLALSKEARRIMRNKTEVQRYASAVFGIITSVLVCDCYAYFSMQAWTLPVPMDLDILSSYRLHIPAHWRQYLSSVVHILSIIVFLHLNLLLVSQYSFVSINI